MSRKIVKFPSKSIHLKRLENLETQRILKKAYLQSLLRFCIITSFLVFIVVIFLAATLKASTLVPYIIKYLEINT